MNKLFLIGNLTRDPELTETGAGIKVCRFAIAVNRSYVAQGADRVTDFFNITVWRNLAENCGKYLKKASKVSIVAHIQNHQFEDKDGNKRTVIDIIGDEVEFLSTKGTSTELDSGYYPDVPAESSSTQKETPTLEPIDEGTLPF